MSRRTRCGCPVEVHCVMMCAMGGFVLRGVQRRYLIAVWPPCGVVFGACTSVCCAVCCGGWAVCSVGGNRIGGAGATAIAAGLWHVPSLTSLKYVCVDGRVWGVRQARICGAGCSCVPHAEAVHVVCECVGRGEEADE